MKKIKQSVINTFNRCSIPYEELLEQHDIIKVYNRFGGGSCETNNLIAFLIGWVYKTSNDYETGIQKVRLNDGVQALD